MSAQPTVSKEDGKYMAKSAMPIINDVLEHMCKSRSTVVTKPLKTCGENFDLKRAVLPVGNTSDAITSHATWGISQTNADGEDIVMARAFADDPARAAKFSSKLDLGNDPNMPNGAANNSLFLDYSKNLITESSLNSLMSVANAAGVPDAIRKMKEGEPINVTEKRSVLHTALRNFSDRKVLVNGKDVMPDVIAVRKAMETFTNKVHSGEVKGATNKAFKYIVNIGIGGSDLGPAMVVEALKPFHKDGMKVFFVSNVDGAAITDALKQVNLEETLFVVASKTFTTQETLSNANAAKNAAIQGIKADAKEVVAKHFIALSTNAAKVTDFGIDKDNMFTFWDWVGGRFSLWSAIGMSIALAVGYSNFEELLRGAQTMDEHFFAFDSQKLQTTMPIVLAMIGVRNNNFAHMHSQAIIPYSQHLARFPAFLQQLDMESNGKSAVAVAGKHSQTGETTAAVGSHTGPVIFGEAGTGAQHSFFQMLHQGTSVIPVDFIGTLKTHCPVGDQHKQLMANMFAQSKALMVGRSATEVREELASKYTDEKELDAIIPHCVFPGNRPSNTILLGALTPRSLGALIALYEHKVFVQGTVWGINSFDQWGVELGKVVATTLLSEMAQGTAVDTHDASTNALMTMFNQA